MNERIKELAEQAEDWADNQNFYESDYRDYLMEKFAKLIIQECADFVAAGEFGDSGTAKELKEHFGVEDQVENSN